MTLSRALAVALLFSAVLIAPDIAAAADEPNPTPPPQTNQQPPPKKDNQSKKPKKDKSSSAEDFLAGYHAAYALVYDKGDYLAGIAALRRLGYYGMWHAEQGNVLKAKDDLEKVRLICGTDCRAYRMLKDVIDGTATY